MILPPDDTRHIQAGRFQKGTSGNLNGRPKGGRNTATMAAKALFDGKGEALTGKCIERALGGNRVSMRFCLKRLSPPRRDRPVSFALPPITSVRDVVDISAAV